MTETELIDYLQLNFSPGIGPATFLKLVSDKPCASSILNSTDRELRSISGDFGSFPRKIKQEEVTESVLTTQGIRRHGKAESEFRAVGRILFPLLADDAIAGCYG